MPTYTLPRKFEDVTLNKHVLGIIFPQIIKSLYVNNVSFVTLNATIVQGCGTLSQQEVVFMRSVTFIMLHLNVLLHRNMDLTLHNVCSVKSMFRFSVNVCHKCKQSEAKGSHKKTFPVVPEFNMIYRIRE